MGSELVELLEAVNLALGRYLDAVKDRQDAAAVAALPREWAGADVAAGAALDPAREFMPDLCLANPTPAGAFPAAATAPAPPAPPAAATGDLDVTGAPWDPAIHSEAKTKNADGRWRVKRRSAAAASAPPAPPAPAAAAAPEFPAVAAGNVPEAPAAPAPLIPGEQVVKDVVLLLIAQKTTREQVQAALAASGIADLGALRTADPAALEKFRVEFSRVSQ
jgi:hypothetical protein